jgi:hypothetical protein
MEGQGAGPPSPWLGPAPEANARNGHTRARAPCGCPGEAASRGSGEESRLATSLKNGMASRPLRLHGPALPRSACAASLHTRRGPELRPGPRGAASLWGLFPAGPSSSTLAPSPLEGRVCGPCPERGTGKRPGSSAELPTFGWTLCSLIGPARPAPAREGEATPRRCSPPFTAHTPPATGVSGGSLAAAGSWAKAALLLSSKPGQHSRRRPASGTHRPRRIRAWPPRGGVTAPGYGRSGRLAGPVGKSARPGSA